MICQFYIYSKRGIKPRTPDGWMGFIFYIRLSIWLASVRYYFLNIENKKKMSTCFPPYLIWLYWKTGGGEISYILAAWQQVYYTRGAYGRGVWETRALEERERVRRRWDRAERVFQYVLHAWVVDDLRPDKLICDVYMMCVFRAVQCARLSKGSREKHHYSVVYTTWYEYNLWDSWSIWLILLWESPLTLGAVTVVTVTSKYM